MAGGGANIAGSSAVATGDDGAIVARDAKLPHPATSRNIDPSATAWHNPNLFKCFSIRSA